MGSFNDDLVLGLGLSRSTAVQESSAPKAVEAAAITDHHLMTRAPASRSDFATTLTLGLSGDHPLDHHHQNNNNNYQPLTDVKKGSCDQEAYSPHSGVSNSFSNGGKAVKRERDASSEELEIDNHQGDDQRVMSSRLVGSDEDEDGMNYSTNCSRKKLRLTKEQSALLEESFKQHSTLNPKEKQTLARQLNLRPRQVEVWFQNRRARTKLKQTEVDCEFLKKCCESLTDENKRLQKEVQELKAMKISQATSNLYMKLPAATLTMCPSCEKINNGRLSPNRGVNPKTSLISMAVSNKPHYYNPFTNPAAC